MPRWRRWLALVPPAALVAVAAALRFWALGFGLPHPLTRPDEEVILGPSWHFARGDLNPHYHVYPGLYLYLVWLWGEAGLALRRLVVATPPYPVTLMRDLLGEPGGTDGGLLLIGRVLTALAGTATVAAVYRLARPREGRAVAAVAAALVATCFLHVRDSHAIKPDVPLGLAILPALAACARVVRAPDVRTGAMAGTAIGVATGMKQPGILLLVPLYLAAVRGAAVPGWRRWVPGAAVVAGVALAVGVFLATGPYLVLDAGFAWRQMAPATHTVFAARTSVPERAFAYHAAVSLRYGMGLLCALLVLPAGVLALVAREPLWWVSGVFALVWYAVIGSSPVHHVRYLTPLVPVLALLVAVLLGRLAAAAGARRAPLVLALATAALVWEPLGASIAHDRILSRTDTRVLATRWLGDHARQGDTVAVLGTNIWPYGMPIMPPGVQAEKLGPEARTLGGAAWVLTHDHPLEFSHVDPQQLAAFLPALHLEAEFSPFADDRAAGWFERADAYYAPFHDFAGVVRPGPVVRIYSVRADTTRTGASAEASGSSTPSWTTSTRTR